MKKEQVTWGGWQVGHLGGSSQMTKAVNARPRCLGWGGRKVTGVRVYENDTVRNGIQRSGKQR